MLFPEMDSANRYLLLLGSSNEIFKIPKNWFSAAKKTGFS
jgi:hypothetical protein